MGNLKLKSGGYATVLFINEDKHGKQLLLQKKDRGWKGEDFWTVFGGHIEDGETPVDCIVREVEEELGITIPANVFKLFETIQIPHGDISVPLHLFITPFTGKISDIRLSEGCGFAFWYFDEVKKLPLVSHERTLLEKFIAS